MAKIEMDLSEYQEIQKVNRLLEESLDKERALADEVAKLKQEKIDILKDNEKSVTIIERIDSVDTVKTLLPHDVILQNLFQIFQERGGNSYSIDAYDHMGQPIVYRLAEAFFKTERQKMYSQEKSITRVGFDEVKKEAKDEFLKDLSEESKRRRESLESEVKDLRESVVGYDALKEANKKLLKDAQRLNNNYQFYRESTFNYAEGLNEILDVLKDKFTFFNSKVKVGLIKKIIRETRDEDENLKKNRK